MPSARKVALEELSLELFHGLTGQEFRAEGETKLELTEALPLDRRREIDGRQCFSLVFRRLAGPELQSRLYSIEHDAFEIPALFLSRIQYSHDPRDQNSYYESIFN